MNTPKPRILMVDDEPNILSGYRRQLGRRYIITTAESGPEALQVMGREEAFPVVFTDMRMPGMDGLAFLQAAAKVAPESVYMMLTGNADQQTAIDAINKGNIFRFLNKPCSPEDLNKALRAGLRQHELIQSERVLLRDTLSGSVKLLIETMTISHPRLGQMSSSIRNDIQIMCQELNLPSDWRIPLAASLSLLGCVVVGGGAEADAMTDDYLATCAQTGANLLRHIPRLQEVAEIVERQREEGPFPQILDYDNPECRSVVAARLLRFLIDLQRDTDKANGNRIAALRALKANTRVYDRRILEAAVNSLTRFSDSDQKRGRRVRTRMSVRALKVGMELDQDILTNNYTLLISKGQTLNAVMIERLRTYEKADLAEDQVYAYTEHRDDSSAKKIA